MHECIKYNDSKLPLHLTTFFSQAARIVAGFALLVSNRNEVEKAITLLCYHVIV